MTTTRKPTDRAVAWAAGYYTRECAYDRHARRSPGSLVHRARDAGYSPQRSRQGRRSQPNPRQHEKNRPPQAGATDGFCDDVV